MNNFHQEMFYDQTGSRSPGSQRHQSQAVHRQSSRQFDAYGQMPNLFNPDDQPQRFETNRFDRMNGGVATGGFGNYDMGAAQTWNPNAFGASPAFSPFGASRTMKPSARGRTGLPAVCSMPIFIFVVDTSTVLARTAGPSNAKHDAARWHRPRCHGWPANAK